MADPNRYTVSIPIAGKITFHVEATSEEEATTKAWEAYEEGTQNPDLWWEAHSELMTGNCQNYEHNDVEVTKCAPRKRPPD